MIKATQQKTTLLKKRDHNGIDVRNYIIRVLGGYHDFRRSKFKEPTGKSIFYACKK